MAESAAAAGASEQPKAEPMEMGEAEMWGVFDEEDLVDVGTSELVPPPIAAFESEDEAKGYVLLAAWGHMAPAIRRCTVRGTVTLTSEDVGGSHAG